VGSQFLVKGFHFIIVFCVDSGMHVYKKVKALALGIVPLNEAQRRFYNRESGI